MLSPDEIYKLIWDLRNIRDAIEFTAGIARANEVHEELLQETCKIRDIENMLWTRFRDIKNCKNCQYYTETKCVYDGEVCAILTPPEWYFNKQADSWLCHYFKLKEVD